MAVQEDTLPGIRAEADVPLAGADENFDGGKQKWPQLLAAVITMLKAGQVKNNRSV